MTVMPDVNVTLRHPLCEKMLLTSVVVKSGEILRKYDASSEDVCLHLCYNLPLLFKSRVVQQQEGERNFHSFYQVSTNPICPWYNHLNLQWILKRPCPMCVSQLLRGGSEELLESLHLQNDPAVYTYTKEGAAATVGYRWKALFCSQNSCLEIAEIQARLQCFCI